MSSLPYLEISAPVIKYGVALTLCINSFLIYVTNNHIKTINTAYKFLIVLEASLGIIFSLIEILITPFIHSYNASFIYFSSTAATSKSLIIRLILLSAYSLTYMVIICGLAIQFIYRYLVVLAPKSLKWFRGWRATVWIVYGSVFSVIWVAGLNQMLPDDYSKKYVGREMEKNYGFDVDHLASYQLVAYDNQGQMRFHNCLGLSTLTTILTFQYVIVLFFGIKTHFGIKSIVAVTSTKAHRLHTQLFKTLVLQITVPTVFYNSPVFLMYLSPYLDMKYSFPSGLMILCFNFYPAVDSLILMWMVGEYHRVIKKLVGSIVTILLRWSETKTVDDTTDGMNNQRI